MKKRGAICLVFCLVLCFCSIAVPVAASDLQQNASILNGPHSLDAKNPLLGSGQIVENTESAIVFEVNSQTLMYAWNCDERMAPASFVKILTALIVSKQADLNDAVTVKESVLNSVPQDAVTVNLKVDEVLTVKDLLYCMMVGSANDAAAVLADHVYGSQEAFVEEMNRYAKTLGCLGSNFTNVHGLHDENQYTTARDVAKILYDAVGNEIFRSVFEAVQYTVPATNKSDARTLITGNYLMNQNQDSVEIYYDARVTGGRTGVTSSGLRCIAATAQSNGMMLISVLMGSKSVYQTDGYTVQIFGGYKETSALLDAGFGDFQVTQLIHPDQSIIQCRVENGSSDVVLGARQPVYTVLPQGISASDLDYRYTNIGVGFHAPVKKGDALSSVEIWYNDSCVGQVELFALNSVPVWQNQIEDGGAKNNGSNWTQILIVAVCCALGFGLLSILLRAVGRSGSAKSRSRRHSKNHRRGG